MCKGKRMRRYLSLALGYIERGFDEEQSRNPLFSKEAVSHIKTRNHLTDKESEDVKIAVDEVLNKARETCSALDEFTLCSSGKCEACGDVVLYGQNGVTLEFYEDLHCCTYCLLEKKILAKKLLDINYILHLLNAFSRIEASSRIKGTLYSLKLSNGCRYVLHTLTVFNFIQEWFEKKELVLEAGTIEEALIELVKLDERNGYSLIKG